MSTKTSSMASLDRPNVRSNPPQFLDLPFEIRRQIIKLSISQKLLSPQTQSGTFRTGDETEPHDFTINASGLKCRFLKPFNLFAINRQVRRETMIVIFQQSSLCIQVDIPRYGGLSKFNTSVPGAIGVLKTYPLLCQLARDVTVIFHPELSIMSGPLIRVDGGVLSLIREHPGISVLLGVFLGTYAPIYTLVKLTGWAHRAIPFQQRHTDLEAFIDILTHGFKSRKCLKIIVYLNDLYLQDLKFIIGLFQARSCSISFEERWLQWYYRVIRSRVVGKYEADYERFVKRAAEEAGDNPLLAASPILDEFEVEETDVGDVRGCMIIGKRRRVWLAQVS